MANYFDAHKNFAYSLVATAPSPATSGTSLVVTASEGSRFPAVPFNATICPAGAVPTPANSEIVRVTAISTDTLTIVRAQESTSARTVVVGDQIFAGATAKEFTDLEAILKGAAVYNVKAYGAVGDNSTDDTTAIQAAIDAANTAGGGIVFFPAATYKITAALNLKSYVTLMGAAAASSTTGACINQTSTTLDAIRATNTTTSTTNFGVENLRIQGTGGSSAHGIYLKNTGSGGTYPPFTYARFKNLYIAGFTGTNAYGFVAESLIVATIQDVEVETCTNGFYLNGHGDGGAFSTVNTSVSFINTYANGCTTNGYNIRESTYIHFSATACDFPSGSGVGYLIDTSACVSFTGCGAELSGTFSGQLWKFTGATQCQMIGCYFFQNDNVCVLVTGTSTGITLIGCQNNSDTSTATVGLQVDAGSQVTDIDCDWGTAPNPDTPLSINGTGIYRTPGKIRVTTEASSATPTINVGRSDMHSITALAAAITSMTTNLTGTPLDGQTLVIRIKDNGTARAITWGASFEAKGVALPTTTVISKVLTVGFIYDSVSAKWGCVASAQEG